MNLKKYFITGLVTLLPLTVTIFVLAMLVNFLTQPFLGIASDLFLWLGVPKKGFFFLSADKFVHLSSQVFVLVILLGSTILLGMVTRWFFITSLLKLSDSILHRIPVVNTVYKTTQDIIKTLFVSDKSSFKKVVLVPYPMPNVYMVGLVAREAPLPCSQAAQSQLWGVLIPTTPNPTTGFLLFYRKEDLLFLDIRPEDAIKLIVSCGVIHPGADFVVNGENKNCENGV